MKNRFMLFMACAITMAVAVSQDNGKEYNPSASFSPARQFDATLTTISTAEPPTPYPKTTTPHPNTTTPHPNTTTPHPNTTTPHPNTTTPHPKTTTPHPNTTTPHPNTTTPHPKTTTPYPNTTTPHPNTTTPHPNTTTPHPNTTTPHPKTTTPHPNTTTPHPNTTTPHPNTTTPHPNTTTPHPNTTTPHPNTTTPHPSTTTPHPNTTTPHPKTTTPHPNTTTPHPNTTTPHPKPTPPHPNTTTTPHPNTTTPHPKTTNPTTLAPQPTPKTNLTAGNYTLKSGKDVCALAIMALEIRVEYDTKNKFEGTYIVQPGQTSVEGSCEKLNVDFTLKFKEGSIHFQFQKNVSEELVYVSSVAVELTYPFDPADPKTMYKAGNSSVKLFPAAIGHSYSCRSQVVYLGKGINLNMTQGTMQAFNITNNSFGQSDDCPADHQPDYRVAIAVGIVLLILIIIVVVAYLIGRRRRTDGYQSL